MFKSKKLIFVISITVCLFLVLSACVDKATVNDKEYWFSNWGSEFIEYDDTANNGAGNIDEAGTYWRMTIKRDCTISIGIRVDTDNYYSTMYCFVNDNQILSDDPGSSMYSYIYKDVSLKKGDKLVLHAFWTNSLKTNNYGFNMLLFAIIDGPDTYWMDDLT